MLRTLAAVFPCLLLATQTLAAPIVFDFEDSLQGWELRGSAQRVQTQVLGGEWAIFGDGLAVPPQDSGQFGDIFVGDLGTYISMVLDLTDIVSISVEQFSVAGDEAALSLDFGSLVSGQTFPFQVERPGNPSIRTTDVPGLLRGPHRVMIGWSSVSSPPASVSIVAFIDNITFHPIPEPGHLGVLGLIGLLVLRRCLV